MLLDWKPVQGGGQTAAAYPFEFIKEKGGGGQVEQSAGGKALPVLCSEPSRFEGGLWLTFLQV